MSASAIYAYVGNDPLNMTDPSGTTAEALGSFGQKEVSGFNYDVSVASDILAFDWHQSGLDRPYNDIHGLQSEIVHDPLKGLSDLGNGMGFMPLEGAIGTGAAAVDETETFFRTMSQEDYLSLQATDRIAATGETTISRSLPNAFEYTGVTVQFSVSGGTSAALLNIGVRNVASDMPAMYASLPLVQKGWSATSAFFKYEDGPVNIGLGRGTALDIFNSNILKYTVVHR